ncbi:hypothetical protein LUZ60_011280 [Juncus effusus]|nr:hypothetical protein LUZ60_011280 [Juncus effusus]
MKFGKDFKIHLEQTLPEWRDKFLCYKPLKKLIKNLPAEEMADQNPAEWFVGLLEEELEKFNDFYVDKEEDFVIRLQELKGRIEQLKNRDPNISELEYSEELFEIRRAFVTIHGEMVLLKNYSSLNFAGLVKIVKKYDKRTGRLLTLPFTQRVLHQPFFTPEPLTRLVHECEANLELLFPLLPEVIEAPTPQISQNPNSTSQNPQNPNSNHNQQNPYPNPQSPNPSSPNDQNVQLFPNSPNPNPNLQNEQNGPGAGGRMQEETVEVYKSTLAAMRAIQGLRKKSSTVNPLSIGRFFDDENGSGAVTSDSDADLVVGLDFKSQEVDQDQDRKSETVYSD